MTPDGDGEKTSMIVVHTKDIPWAEAFNDRIGRALLRKELFTDPETGVMMRLVRYPAGVINPNHTHPCGHGMYVLEGKLVTHQGTFGPGTFVWFPEGEAMEHGASAEGDVTVLFVTNKAFRIDYVDQCSI
jgi:quercetin dioxygenase-like cupin family protein